MDNETTKKRMTKDEKWLLYVQNVRIEERNKAIDECLNEVIGMEERSCDDAFKFAYEIVVDNLNRLKGKQQ